MRLRFALLSVVMIAVAACQPGAPAQTLPTLAVLPSLTLTNASTVTPTDTAAPSETITPAPQVTSTSAPTHTQTPFPTATPVPSNTPTVMAAASATAAVLEAPVFSTLRPNARSTPQVQADVIITEAQFQEALDAQIAGSDAIQSARVDFLPGGIDVELTALGGEAFITGNVTLAVELTGSFIAISPVNISVNAPEPPPAYVEIVNSAFLSLILTTLDTLLNERLGTDHDLESLTLTDSQMDIRLLVPQS